MASKLNQSVLRQLLKKCHFFKTKKLAENKLGVNGRVMDA